jgi:hypothetical protein
MPTSKEWQEQARISLVVSDVERELAKAIQMHGPMHSKHEGFAVMLEEFDELKDEVWTNERKDPDSLKRMRKEAVQVAATALRFLLDVCDRTTKPNAPKRKTRSKLRKHSS